MVIYFLSSKTKLRTIPNKEDFERSQYYHYVLKGYIQCPYNYRPINPTLELCNLLKSMKKCETAGEQCYFMMHVLHHIIFGSKILGK